MDNYICYTFKVCFFHILNKKQVYHSSELVGLMFCFFIIPYDNQSYLIKLLRIQGWLKIKQNMCIYINTYKC